MNKTKQPSAEVTAPLDNAQRVFEARVGLHGVTQVSNTTRRKLAGTIRQLKKLSSEWPTSEAAQLHTIAQTLKAINETLHKNTGGVIDLAYELEEQFTKRVTRSDGPPRLRLIRGGR